MKRLAALFLLVIFCPTLVFSENLSEEQKLEQINQQLKERKLRLEKTRQEEAQVLSRLAVINKELARTKSNLQQANKKIQVNESQIGNLTEELSQSVSDLRQKETKLQKRIKEVYKSSSVSYLQLVFTSNSMSDFLNRLYFFRKIIDYDAALVGAIKEDVDKVRRKRAILQDKTSEIKSLAKEIAEKKKEIAIQASEKEQLYQTIAERRKAYEAEIAELEKSSKELEVMIMKKMAARQGSKIHGSGVLTWPLEGRITSRFGYRRHPLWGGRSQHTGLDIANKYGTPVKAADDGEVIFAGWWDGYGKAIVVDHGRSISTVYGHLSRIYKQVGTVVAKGQIIGLVGSTGYSTGPHLHFEVRINGKPANPERYL
jgi:murein DD-endopeptidase MepM/ murein hydrolase activator NlpD